MAPGRYTTEGFASFLWDEPSQPFAQTFVCTFSDSSVRSSRDAHAAVAA